MRRRLAAGNWKMNGTAASLAEVDRLIEANLSPRVEILLCPPATLIAQMAWKKGQHPLAIGGQDCHAEGSGAHTGDISAAQLRDAGATYVILGHSERRTDHGETDDLVRTKAQAAHEEGLVAIVCLGETLKQREAGQTLEIVGRQLDASVPDEATGENTVIAYEPVWAIGTGLTPTVDQIAEVHDFLRSRLSARFGADAAFFRLLYGGSVKASNAVEIFAIPEVDGALVGGASLRAADFSPIIEALEQAVEMGLPLMLRLAQSPTDPAFVQDPYPFYDRARAVGDLFWWEDYGLACVTSHRAVSALLRDRRLGREAPPEVAPGIAPHVQPFYDIEAHSMLELEPPRHTRLRGLVLRAFTSRRIAQMGPGIEALCDRLIDEFPVGPFDLLDAYGRVIPVVVIARLLGVPEERAGDLLRWSNAMVSMYQARRTRAVEDAAVEAALAFRAFVEETIEVRRRRPGDDLLTHLIAAEAAGEKLSTDELVTTCILLLNAGHEATVHTMGNGAKALLENEVREISDGTIEEILRFDPPLHMFTRWVYEDAELYGERFRRGDRVALLLGAANRDPAAYPEPGRFDPAREGPANVAFGGGIHFCVGAPLARLELLVGLRKLWERCPGLRLVEVPAYGDVYHFHGLERLMVEA